MVYVESLGQTVKKSSNDFYLKYPENGKVVAA